MLRPQVLPLTLALAFVTWFLPTAAAQAGPPQISCSTEVSVTPILRAEGYTERVADIPFVCAGGTPTESGLTVPTMDIQVFLNTAVTSRIYPSGLSEVLLIIDEPLSGLPGTSMTQLACADVAGQCSITGTGTGSGTYDGSAARPNIFPGSVSGNVVTFRGVPFDPPGSGGLPRILRIANIRVNATALSSTIPTPVVASVSVSNSSILLSNATPTVGFVTPGLSVRFANTDIPSTATPATITSCSTPQRAGDVVFSARYSKRTYAPFVDADTSPAPIPQNIPGNIYSSETGFYAPSLTSTAVDFSSVGLAGFGTRVQATFDMRSGARVWVSLLNDAYSIGNIPSVARLVSSAAGGFSPAAATATLGGVPAFELIPTNGFATATWEVLEANSNLILDLHFRVWVQAGSAGSGSFTAQFAPSPATPGEVAAYAAASSTLPEPRFSFSGPIHGLFYTAGCQAPTTIGLSANPAVVTTGLPVTLTANVGSVSGTPGGTVSFYEGATMVGAPTLVSGSASVSVTPTLGQHTYTASYAGNTAYAPSSSLPVTVTVNAPLTTSLTLSANPVSVTPGAPTTLTATVTSSSGTPGGTISFSEGATAVGSVNLVNGVATLSLTPSPGQHTYSASYAGSGGYPAAGPATVTVTAQAATATTLATSAGTITPGASATLSVKVTSSSGTPAGAVTFYEGASPIGSANLANGSATLVITPSLGFHSYTASYAGNSSYAASSSGPVTVTAQTPAHGNSDIRLTSSASPSIVGQSVTFTATVSGDNATPTGTVRFADGSQVLGTSNLSAGQATLTTTFTDARTHDIFASYSGDGGYSDATVRFGQLVNPVTGTLTLSVSPVTATNGQSISLTAQLSAPPAGAPAATGTITFYEGGTVLGSAKVSGGAASMNTSALSAGTHQVTARYGGDSNWYSIQSQPVTVTVSPAASGTVLSAAFASTGATLTATVGGTGTVQFVDNNTGTVLGSSQLDGGTASLRLAPADVLALAGHSVVAKYSGSANLLPGVSNAVVLVAMINAAGNLSASFAAEELTTILGAGLGDAAQQAKEAVLPEALGGVALAVSDATGQTRNAKLSYVSPSQVNLLLPEGLATGQATFTLSRAGAPVFTLKAMIAPVAPGLFTVSGDGRGPAAAQVQREGETIYLVLYGTGIRNRASVATVSCVVGGQAGTVLYAGKQADMPGLDQVNVLVPAALRGAGEVPVVVTVDGQQSNTVTVSLR